MTLSAYWLGQSIVAASSPEEAVQVMERHEPVGKWLPTDAQELNAEELSVQVDPVSSVTVAVLLERCQGEKPDGRPDSRLAMTLAQQGRAQLIRWAYPER